jgi:hypothetical protein
MYVWQWHFALACGSAQHRAAGGTRSGFSSASQQLAWQRWRIWRRRPAGSWLSQLRISAMLANVSAALMAAGVWRSWRAAREKKKSQPIIMAKMNGGVAYEENIETIYQPK